MTNDEERDEAYLWDRSGPADPDVERLEKLLSPLALGEPPALPAEAPVAEAPRRRWLPVAMAAALLLVGGLGLWWWLRTRGEPAARDEIVAVAGADAGTDEIAMCTTEQPADGPALKYQVLSGQMACDSDLGPARGGWLPVGSWLETDAETRVAVEVADLGSVAVDPGSRLRVVAIKPDEHRLQLAHGALEAVISAPPRIFFVDTAAATAVDLGCRYRLEVDEQGTGILHVTTGWVALERGDQSSLVPQGASCEIDSKAGPGTPFASQATPELRAALRRFDFGGDTGAVAAVITATGPADTLTLWHLLPRVDEEMRGAIHDRLAQLVKPPPGAVRAAVVAGDPAALAAWKETLEPLWLFGVTAEPPAKHRPPPDKQVPNPWGGKPMFP